MQNNRINSLLEAAVLGCLLLACPSTLPATALPLAAQEPATRPQGPPPGRGPGASAEQRADELAKSLQLSDQQKADVTAIFKDQQQQMQALRSSADGDRQKGMEQMRKLQSDTDAKLKAVLTAEQYTKYQAQRPQRGRGGRPPQGE